MISLFFQGGMLPFTGAFLLIVGLIGLELVALLLGGSLMGADADGPDLDVDLDGPDLGDIDVDADFEVDLDAVEAEVEATSGVENAGGPLAWLGLGEAPFILWLAGMAASFGLSGMFLQFAVERVAGGMLPAALAVLIAAAPGLIGGRIFARAIMRIMPKTESSAVSRRHLGGRLGIITQGTAERGRPAEAKVRDRAGAWQYIRVEPREDGVRIPQGTDVIVFRPKGGIYPVMPFGED